MEPVQLHMLLNLIISEDEMMLKKAKIAPLKALLVAYAKEGTTAMTGGTKAMLVPRVAAAIRAAGTTGFARAPVFGAADGVADEGGGAEEGAEDAGLE